MHSPFLLEYQMAIVVAKESSYEYQGLRRSVFDILERLDGGLIGRGSRVLLKPNFLAPAPPEKAITTHPLVIKAAVEYILEKGGRALVADSSAMGGFDRVVSVCGVKEVLSGMPVELRELGRSRKVEVDGRFGSLELSADALEADVIINMPKLKTHAQMGLTLAVKNLFGCVVGMRKPEWHYRVGDDKELFAELLVTIYRVLKPSVNLLDGILAMEGDGPGTGGTPRRLNVLAGSADALSLDTSVCRMLGMEAGELLTNWAAARMGHLEEEVSGDLPRVSDFIIPDTVDLMFGPRFAQGFLRRHVASLPSSVQDICKLCGECAGVCPAKAIEEQRGKLHFDYDKCIRCYCCIEVCPHGAVKKRDTLLKKIITRYYNSRRR